MGLAGLYAARDHLDPERETRYEALRRLATQHDHNSRNTHFCSDRCPECEPSQGLRSIPVHLADHYYHVYNRGCNRESIFATDGNYVFLLGRAKSFLADYPLTMIAH